MTPAQLEARDGYFSSLVEQTEAMVAADPEHRPAVVIGFSLGCLIGKYFMHFCQAAKGDAWTASHLQHFVSLGGPFRGSVNLTRAVLVDGLFPPLNMLFNESQMLTILRSVPVGPTHTTASAQWTAMTPAGVRPPIGALRVLWRCRLTTDCSRAQQVSGLSLEVSATATASSNRHLAGR